MANTTPKRFQFTRRIHDNIARQFARKDFFLAVVEILQAIDFHLSGSDAVEGMKKNSPVRDRFERPHGTPKSNS